MFLKKTMVTAFFSSDASTLAYILFVDILLVNKVKDTEAMIQKCSAKEMFLEISQNSQGNTCARVSF